MKQIKRKVTTEDQLVSVQVSGDKIRIETFSKGGEESGYQHLTRKEAKQLRKALKQAIVAAKNAADPF